MQTGRQIALGFASCKFCPFLSALLVQLIPNCTVNHAIAYINALYTNFYPANSFPRASKLKSALTNDKIIRCYTTVSNYIVKQHWDYKHLYTNTCTLH